MKKIAFLLLLSVVFTACNTKTEEKNDQYILNGSLSGIQKPVIGYVLHIENNQFKPIDTFLVENSVFNYSNYATELPDIYFLKFEGFRGQVPFVISDNTDRVNFEINTDNLFESKVSGGQDNDILKEFTAHNHAVNTERKTINTAYAEAMSNNNTELATKLIEDFKVYMDESNLHLSNFVTKHSKSIVSIIAIENMLVTSSHPIENVETYFNSLPEHLKSSRIGLALNKTIAAKIKTEIGAIAPEFEGQTPSGDNFKLSSLTNKITIVDFWAAWCAPCRRENPNLVKIYEKYHDKGLEIVGISLDGHPNQDDPKAEWLKAIEVDNLDWIHVSNLDYFNGPIPKQYNISAIPATFVLDENKKIIAKDLRGNELDAKIAELLN